MNALDGEAMEKMRDGKKNQNTGLLSPKKDKEAKLSAAVISGLVCD